MTLHEIISWSIRNKTLLVTWDMMRFAGVKLETFGQHVLARSLSSNVDVVMRKRPMGLYVEWIIL